MNRNELIKALKLEDPFEPVTAYYNGLIVAIDRVGSYRGSYDCIGLEVDERNFINDYNVGKLIKELEDTNVLHGYKGGEYSVNEHANVYVSPYGYNSGMCEENE